MTLARARVIVSGAVQGVFFRSSTNEMAGRLGVKGWVRNRSDGKLEAVFEGEKEAVARMVGFCHHGPTGAHVDDIEVKWEPHQGEFSGFSVRY